MYYSLSSAISSEVFLLSFCVSFRKIIRIAITTIRREITIKLRIDKTNCAMGKDNSLGGIGELKVRRSTIIFAANPPTKELITAEKTSDCPISERNKEKNCFGENPTTRSIRISLSVSTNWLSKERRIEAVRIRNEKIRVVFTEP